MNRGIKVLQTSALPLGYVAPKLGWMMGFEPTNDGATTRCLNHLTTPTMMCDCSHKINMKFGDPDRARTDDLQRDRLAF